MVNRSGHPIRTAIHDLQSTIQVFSLRALCALIILCGCISFAVSCDKPSARALTLYTSIDEPIARPIIQEFEKKTGIKVTLVTDAEASKTVGLAERLRAEKANPQADVWWGNEPFHTINLANEGLFEPSESRLITHFDFEMSPRYRDAERRWHCVGLRGRMIVTADGYPLVETLEQLLDPSLKRKICMARPTTGTTGGHVAALYVLWGDEKADAFFRALRGNEVKLLGGNSVVAESVGKGTMLAGITDNDDAEAVLKQGYKLRRTLHNTDNYGALAIPTTMSLVKGSKHRDAAIELIEFLLSPETEQKLIDAEFCMASIRAESRRFKAMDVSYAEVAQKLPEAVRRATAILEGRE